VERIGMLIEPTDEGTIRIYPDDKPYAQYDQGRRPPEELDRIVIQEAADLLESEGFLEEATKAKDELAVFEEWYVDGEWKNENFFSNDCVQTVENIEHILIDWNGDAGTVTVTISDYWYEEPDWKEVYNVLSNLVNFTPSLSSSDSLTLDALRNWIKENRDYDY
jgi:hypothetical protein